MPEGSKIWCDSVDGPLVSELKFGKGRVIYQSAYLGDAQREHWTVDFEDFVAQVSATAGAYPDAVVSSPASSRKSKVIVRSGSAGNTPLVFVLGPPNTEFQLRFRKGLFAGSQAQDIISGKTLGVDGKLSTLPASAWGLHVLKG